MNRDSDSWPVATPVPVPALVDTRPRWRWPRLEWPRGPEAWRQYAIATTAALVFLGVCFLAWPWIVGTSEHTALTPEPVETRFFPIDRVEAFDGGVRIFGYGERTGDTTRVISYELHWADVSTAASAAASPDRDAGPPDMDRDNVDPDVDRDDVDRFIDNARPIPEITPPSPGVPRPVVQRRTMTWRGGEAESSTHSVVKSSPSP